jgi:hypothetical protein
VHRDISSLSVNRSWLRDYAEQLIHAAKALRVSSKDRKSNTNLAQVNQAIGTRITSDNEAFNLALDELEVEIVISQF